MPYSEKRPNSEYYPSRHHQAQFADLATQRDEQRRVCLNSLVDGEPGDRPSYPIPTIIKCAILGSPREQLTLSEIYTAMEERFLFYKCSDKKSWRNSVRHNLSLNNQFEKKTRPMTEPGKGHYWVVVPDMPLGNKWARKRNMKLGKRALAAATNTEATRSEEAQSVGGVPEPSADISADLTKSAPNVHSNKSGDAEVAVEPPIMPVHPAARPGRITGTLPADAGSYAAVTGVVKLPEINRQSYWPWPGDNSSTTSSICDDTSKSPSVRPQDAPNQAHDTSSTTDRPPSGNSLLHPAALSSPTQFEGGSCVGPQRSSSSRGSRRYPPMAVRPSPSTCRSALSAQLAREGTGPASGTGG
ncbi:hypothetical protein JB92DRAFT_347311 [Gautieria morchelliformis]|nr:hypothetical protein JB92DRAFT_347311 [Gautieria morchelliformis]